MAAENQKLSEIRKLPGYTAWPTSRNFVDPCWLENKSLLMTSETIVKDTNKRKSRDMSTRFTYGELHRFIFKLLTTAITGQYTLPGRFNFATNATNVYCSNTNGNATPGGRYVITYKNLSDWLANRSGFENTIKNITYGDHVDPKFCKKHDGPCNVLS